MRGEPNKRHNKKITRPCPVCGGRVIVAHRNRSWWIRCDDDPFHIKYKPYEDPYSAIRAFNAQTNADRIRSLSDKELAEFFHNMIQDCGCNNVPCQKFCMKTTCEQAWLDWLKEEAKGET